MDAQKLKHLIETHLADHTQAFVETDDNVHFDAVIISDLFEGLSLVKRQQKVYACLGELIANGSVHALSLKTYTPEEYAQVVAN